MKEHVLENDKEEIPAQSPPVSFKKVYTLSDIATHNKANDLFVAVHGKVYDVTSFKAHPGGFRVL